MKTQKKKIDLEKYYEEFLNDNYPPIIIFEKYKYLLGTTLYKFDYTLFVQASLDFQDSMLKDEQWVEIDGEVYEK